MHTPPQFFSSRVAVTALIETLLAFIVADPEDQMVAEIECLHRVRAATGVSWTDGD